MLTFRQRFQSTSDGEVHYPGGGCCLRNVVHFCCVVLSFPLPPSHNKSREMVQLNGSIRAHSRKHSSRQRLELVGLSFLVALSCEKDQRGELVRVFPGTHSAAVPK